MPSAISCPCAKGRRKNDRITNTELRILRPGKVLNNATSFPSRRNALGAVRSTQVVSGAPAGPLIATGCKKVAWLLRYADAEP